jgi:hypothetical protein
MLRGGWEYFQQLYDEYLSICKLPRTRKKESKHTHLLLNCLGRAAIVLSKDPLLILGRTRAGPGYILVSMTEGLQ